MVDSAYQAGEAGRGGRRKRLGFTNEMGCIASDFLSVQDMERTKLLYHFSAEVGHWERGLEFCGTFWRAFASQDPVVAN